MLDMSYLDSSAEDFPITDNMTKHVLDIVVSFLNVMKVHSGSAVLRRMNIQTFLNASFGLYRTLS